jgi:Putative restriction endonuclease
MKPHSRTPTRTPLPLHNGDHMKQPEFHRRYKAYAEDVRFELIGGVVYMASPLKRKHGVYHPEVTLVLSLYKAGTPGVEVADNMTAILGEESEPQPDLMLRLLTECGGQSKYDEEEFLVGAPELIAEVAHSSLAIDMGRKRQDYLAAGVQEYVVLCVEEQELHWFHFPSRRKLKSDRNGLWKSRVFPGLWIAGTALIAQDSAGLIAAVQQGLATPEHAEFVRRLEERRQRTDHPDEEKK